nr:hypothetical protein CFP56_03023 [Quercus suber]
MEGTAKSKEKTVGRRTMLGQRRFAKQDGNDIHGQIGVSVRYWAYGQRLGANPKTACKSKQVARVRRNQILSMEKLGHRWRDEDWKTGREQIDSAMQKERIVNTAELIRTGADDRILTMWFWRGRGHPAMSPSQPPGREDESLVGAGMMSTEGYVGTRGSCTVRWRRASDGKFRSSGDLQRQDASHVSPSWLAGSDEEKDAK